MVLDIVALFWEIVILTALYLEMGVALNLASFATAFLVSHKWVDCNSIFIVTFIRGDNSLIYIRIDSEKVPKGFELIQQ